MQSLSAPLPTNSDQHLGGEQLHDRVPGPRGHYLHLHVALLLWSGQCDVKCEAFNILKTSFMAVLS